MNPSFKAPGAWKSGALCYGPGLTLEAAKKMLEAGEKEAIRLTVPMTMAISDAGGNLLAFHRMDNAALFSSQIAMDKAFTAVYGKLPTSSFSPLFQSGELNTLFFHERWITFPGGFPMVKNGVVMGGLGVSGGKIEDCYVAREILKSGGFDTTDIDEFIGGYEAGLKKPKTRKRK
jgi:uncharacterized protein GlcG (DUF336 family)